MKFGSDFTPIALEELHREAAIMKVDGWRFIQTHAVNTDDGIDLYYSFMKDGHIRNLKVAGVQKEDAVPSITDLFLAAFVFENEARELFGVDMHDIAIDFAGALYAPAEAEPMTFMSPEQKAARDKARKAQAAKAAKDAPGSSADGEAPAQASTAPSGHVFVMTPERRERLDKKLANMSPEKVAKVEAALKAREAEAAAAANAPAAAPAAAKEAASTAPSEKAATAEQKPLAEDKPAIDHDLEAKIAMLSPEKAAKVKAALAARSGVSEQAADEVVAPEPQKLDADLESKLSMMDDAKAQKVREALAAKAAREASSKGGE